jgi:adenylate cyclase
MNPDQPEGERRLAAIMFTDMVGFTGLAQKDESLSLELLEEQRGLMRPIFAKHRGREVKTMGDAFLVEFSSALEAVRCAVEAQETLRGGNARRPEERKIVVRIGIHLGDVVHAGADVAGDAVNVASRIEPLALPGGVCVSGQVYESVVNKVECSFEPLGAQQLKNVESPVAVYRVLGYGARAVPQAKAQLPRDRVAVLPFRNISLDPSDEYFADGMTEELISSVSRTRGLRVIARTSVMRFKGTQKPIAEIGRELNVGSVLEGSVRKSGERLRITVQLVETSNEEPSWSEEYDREVKDVFDVQSDIARKVAEALESQILSGIEAKKAADPEAYVQYLRGRQAWNRRTKADLEEAIRRFEEAIRIDPGYANAYAGLADAHAMLASYATEFVPPALAYPKAFASIKKALELDPALVEAHTSLRVVKFHYDWDWQGAEEEFVLAIRLNPSYAPAHQFFADYLKGMGRFDEAVSEITKARELDPLSQPINAALGHVLYLARRYDEAIAQYRRAIDMDPSFMQTHIWFGRPYLEKGMYAEAIEELQKGVELAGESVVALAMLGHGLASAGRKEEAAVILGKLVEKAKTQYVPSYWISVVYNGFRDRDQTVAWLRKAYEERSSWLVWANVEPRFAWLKDDPGFASIMQAMRLPASPV